MNLPHHPGNDTDADADASASTGSKTVLIAIGGIAALIAIMVILHLTGVVGG